MEAGRKGLRDSIGLSRFDKKAKTGRSGYEEGGGQEECRGANRRRSSKKLGLGRGLRSRPEVPSEDDGEGAEDRREGRMEDRRKAMEANSVCHPRDERDNKRRTVRETEQISYSEKNRKGVNGDGGVRDGGGRGDGGGDGGGGQQGKEEKEKEQEPGQSSGGAAGETLKVLYLNTQSIVKKVGKLGCVMSEEKPDLILMMESWCNSSISDSFLSIDGYELQTYLRMNRTVTAQGRSGGLLVYARTGVVVTKMDINVTFTQYCCFKICDVMFYFVYRSPNATEENMTKLIELVKTVGKESVLIGDFLTCRRWTGRRVRPGGGLGIWWRPWMTSF
jgi:hypothetical protein